jgi:ferritin-like metal-binding protein YciE
MTHTVLGTESAVDVAAPRDGSLERSRRISNQLLVELVRIDASKSRLALELADLFQRSRRLSMRLALAEHRRETKIHLERLRVMITMVAGRDQPAAAPMSEGNFDLSKAGTPPDAAILAQLLRASRTAVAQYEASSATAAAERLTIAANLLTISLSEERQTADRFVSMLRLIDEE